MDRKDFPRRTIDKRETSQSKHVTATASESPSSTIGYKKPPSQHQWKKGQSGNPKGRPRGSDKLNTVVAKLLRQKISVSTSQGTTEKQRIEALVEKLMYDTITKGRVGLYNLTLNLAEKAEAASDAEMERQAGPQTVAEILKDYIE